jgi:hypothetical protein
MSCCGNKRQSLNFFPAINQVELQQETQADINVNNSKKNGETLFRFTGKMSLEVKSLFGSRRYLFTEGSPLVFVLPDDVSLMRAYMDLVEVKDQ